MFYTHCLYLFMSHSESFIPQPPESSFYSREAVYDSQKQKSLMCCTAEQTLQSKLLFLDFLVLYTTIDHSFLLDCFLYYISLCLGTLFKLFILSRVQASQPPGICHAFDFPYLESSFHSPCLGESIPLSCGCYSLFLVSSSTFVV